MAQKYNTKNIIHNFIADFQKQHPEDSIIVEGILLFGSFVNPKNLSKNSDMDLYLVIKNKGYRYRGVKLIDNIEVDYFVNPWQQLRKDFEDAKSNIKKTGLYMLAEGKILLDKNDNLKKLKQESKQYIKSELKKPTSDVLITFFKYFIDDYLKDIEDSYQKKQWFAWQYNMDLLLNYLIESFCKKNQIELVKPKYQKDKIAKQDKRFVKLYEDFVKTDSRDKKMQRIKKFSSYVIENFGGTLSLEWELISPTIK